MKCLNETLIQQYIDNEFPRWKMFRVENHLLHCKECERRVAEHQAKVDLVRAAFNESFPRGFAVPTWQPADRRKIIHRRWTIAGAAAATIAIILTLTFLHQPKEVQAQPQPSMVIRYEIADEYDANQPIGQQEYAVRVYRE